MFLVGEAKKLIGYDMNIRKVLVIPTHVVRRDLTICSLIRGVSRRGVQLDMLFFLQVWSCFDSI